MKTETAEMVVMGRVAAPYGVQGWLKVLPETEQLDSLLGFKTWRMGGEQGWQTIKLKSGKVHNHTLLVKLEGIDDRDAAIACKGQLVAVLRSELPTPGDNEFYWSDLIGLAVRNQQDVDFGRVIDVFATGANDVLVVKSDIERLIPFTAQVVLDVDVEQATMRVDWDEDY